MNFMRVQAMGGPTCYWSIFFLYSFFYFILFFFFFFLQSISQPTAAPHTREEKEKTQKSRVGTIVLPSTAQHLCGSNLLHARWCGRIDPNQSLLVGLF